MWKGNCATGSLSTYYPGIGTFSSTKKFNISGNILSLLYGDNYEGIYNVPNSNTLFQELFKNTKVVNAKDLLLVANKLPNKCYYGMFRGCNSLKAIPALPAIVLNEYCYGYMFENCTSLNSAPKLPATTLANYCY